MPPAMTSACRPSGSGLAQAKALLRADVIARRDAVSAEHRAQRGETLSSDLARRFSAALRPGAFVAAFAAMGSEPDLTGFLHSAYDAGCRVCLPCMVKMPDASRAVMRFVEVERAVLDAREAPFLSTPARSVPFDDASLAGARFVEADELDLVAVPLVAFDTANNRLGYGGGNYDRFLGGLRDDATVFGVAFAEQMVDVVPLEPHDVPLPRIEIA